MYVELIQTEKSHCRKLKILEKVFIVIVIFIVIIISYVYFFRFIYLKTSNIEAGSQIQARTEVA